MFRSANRRVVVIAVANGQAKSFPLTMSSFPDVQKKKDNQEQPQTYSSPIKIMVSGANLLFLKSELLGPVRMAPPVGRNVAETIRQIQAFQLVRETEGGEATPSGWKPGKKTLKPSIELVGKVWQEWDVKHGF